MKDIFPIQNLLTSEECSELIKIAEKSGFQQATVGNSQGVRGFDENRRNNSRVEFTNPELAKMILNRLQNRDVIPANFQGKKLSGLSAKFKFYRYYPGEKFEWHQDGSVARGMYEKSYYTLVMYLNDGCEGGATEFQTGEVISPSKGSAVCFKHELVHRGAEVTRGIKYVLRTDVMYKKD